MRRTMSLIIVWLAVIAVPTGLHSEPQGKGKGKGKGNTGAPKNGGGGNGGDNGDPDAAALRQFNQSDKNKDGFIDVDEMSDRLRPIYKHYDLDNDGRISFEEYKAVYADFRSGNLPAADTDTIDAPVPSPAMRVLKPPVDELDERPIVYRAGHLPSGLPDWFDQLDTNRDGQVGLYEWVAGGRNIEEFKLWDHNDDGFITIEEVISYVRSQTNVIDPSMLATANVPTGNNNRRGGPGGDPGGGPGRGGGGGPMGSRPGSGNQGIIIFGMPPGGGGPGLSNGQNQGNKGNPGG